MNEKAVGTAMTWLGCLYAVLDYLAVSGVKVPESRREWLTLAAGCVLAAIAYLARGRKDLASSAPVETKKEDSSANTSSTVR